MVLRARFRPPHIFTPYIRRAYSTTLNPPENPAPPPLKAAAKLTSRRLISIYGPDATKFLQGLITTSLPLSTGPGIFSCFLNPQGRVLSDAFIYPAKDWIKSLTTLNNSSPDDPSYFLEIDVETSQLIFTSLKRRKLRSKITLRIIEDGEYETWGTWSDKASDLYTDLPEVSALDNRAPGFGKRIVVPAGKFPVGAEIDVVDISRYNLRRMLWGIAEGSKEIIPEVGLPQQSNIDYMGGIDYKKGCYVGQELTIRTHHTGVVRKRILPVQLYTTPHSLPPTTLTEISYDQNIIVPSIERGAQIKSVNRRARAPGTLLSHIGNVGLALCRLETMTDIRLSEVPPTEDHMEHDQFAIHVGEEGAMVHLKAFVPSWHALRQGVC